MANEESAAAAASSAGPATTANAAATGNSTTTASSSKATTVTSTAATSRKKPTVKKATGAGTKAKVKKPNTSGGSTAASGGTAGTTGGSKNATSSNKRKKPVKKDTISVDVVLAEGKAAEQDLVQQREATAQRQADPLWYRIEDVLVTGSSDAPMVLSNSSSSHILPEQVVLVERALASSGLTRAHVTPQAMACLLEQARRYAAELLGDAADYAYTAGRPEVTREDLLLAQEMRPDPANHHSSSTSSSVLQQLPKLHLVAQTVNRVPLPAIPAHCYSGIVLPDPQHQLTARTFDVVSTALDWRKRVQPLPLSPLQQQQNRKKANISSTSKNDNNNTSSVGYGVSRGRQIPIHIKERTNPEKDDGGTKPMDTTTTTTITPPPPATTQTAETPGNTSTALTLTQSDAAVDTTVASGGDVTASSPNPATPPKAQTQPIISGNSDIPPPSSSEKPSSL